MNADPRRPDKIQRYVPAKNHANGEDLIADYMNIVGQPATTAGAAVTGEAAAAEKQTETNTDPSSRQQRQQQATRPDDVQQQLNDELATSNAANVIPTSPQYGVAIIANNLNHDSINNHDPTETSLTTDSATTTATHQPPPPTNTTTNNNINNNHNNNNNNNDDATAKDLHSTPSRNDRFKVVKIASLEPFKRGRWKCMDYVDEAPPPNVVNATKTAQSVGNNGAGCGSTTMPSQIYLQTQSLPQQQIQQMLLQSGFANGNQFFQTNVPAQLIPQGQYFYPQVANVQSQTGQVPQPVPAQFINNQPYFATGVANPAAFGLPQSYPNIQYVPIPAQNSAFVPTSQAIHLPANFQQSQSYSGQPTVVSQSNLNNPTGMMNGHAYPEAHTQTNNQQQQQQPQQQQQQQQAPLKNVVVTTSQSQPQFQQHQSGSYQQQASAPAQSQQATPTLIGAQQVGFDASNVYTNPQFTMSGNSLTTVLDGGGGGVNESGHEAKETNSAAETVSDTSEDPSKNNPVVNAIDNKIEQAMDLVKSHLMYTVREEVEVLKEKIAELMERIQQLETENNYLRSQIPKQQQQQQQQQQGVAAPPPAAAPTTTVNSSAPLQPNVAIVNPTPSAIAQSIGNSSAVNVQGAPQSTTATNQNQQQPPPPQAIPNSSTAVYQTTKEGAGLQ